MTAGDVDFDVVVLGGGPGGYATALRAAGHGLRVAVVEADLVGGTCLHRGCVPSKALLHIGHLADQALRLAELGLAGPGRGLDVAAAGRFRDDVVSKLHRGLEGLLRSRRIDVVRGWGTLVAPTDVEVVGGNERQVVHGRHVVVAVGSMPVELPGVEPDGDRVLSSDDALRLARVPSSALVVGGGAVGVEIASLWRSLGSVVTLVEALDRVLPFEDSDSSAALARAFAERGIDVRTATSVASVDVGPDDVAIELDDGAMLRVDQCLIAVGRRPATDGSGLDQLGVLDDRGYVRVDRWGRSDVDGIWAVGDAVRTLALAHAAFAEGFVVADAIAGRDPAPLDHDLIPRVTYSNPEVASVGLTQAQAEDRLEGVKVTVLPLSGNARALIEGVRGQVKLVHDGGGVLVGAHIVGPSATELIAELGLAVSWDALTSEVANVVHAHPSLSESVREAALAAAGAPFHAHRP